MGSERAGNTDWPKVIERWIQIRLKIDAGDSIPAREAYGDFCRWARSAGIGPCTETRFGRFLSARIVQLGGSKMKKRDRAYYQGVMFKMASEASAAFQAAA